MAGRVGGDLVGVHVARRRRPEHATMPERSRHSAGSSSELGGKVHEVVGHDTGRVARGVRQAREGHAAGARRSSPQPLARADSRFVRRPRHPPRRRRRRPRDRPTVDQLDTRPPSASAPGLTTASCHRRMAADGDRAPAVDRGNRSVPRIRSRCPPSCSSPCRWYWPLLRSVASRRRGRCDRRIAAGQLVLRRAVPHADDRRGREHRRPRRLHRRRLTVGTLVDVASQARARSSASAARG